MSDVELSKNFDPHSMETMLYQEWEAEGCFAPTGIGDAYCIAIPPPNVTGSLHMGHAFQDTIMDALIRYHRMRGRNTLWQAGTDHAGIATQMVVERQLEIEGVSRHDLGREQFIDRVWQWKRESGGTISRQLRRMAASLDWSRERFTMDDALSHAVRQVFVQLYEEDLIYRGKRLVNWDPVLHTALSDLEVISEEEQGYLWHIRYPLSDSSGHLVVATTRPETMLGDTAVAVHPEDERYRDLIGSQVRLPLVDRMIPIIADDYVDPAFGTGCLKITPGHDFNDYDVGQRHGLPVINVLTPDAAIDLEESDYHGLDRYDARKQVVSDLEKRGLIEKIEDHTLMVPRGDRSGAVVEPYLTDQWYVRTKPLAEPAIEAVKDGRIRFVPDNWSRTYYEWMNNIEDWCISRQIWWGHRIPAWYDDDGNIFVAQDESSALEKAESFHGRKASLHQDEDVLDTWFSSALWPFSTLGWPDDTAAMKAFYPTSVLVTGFDIIFFWVARMIMFGLKFTGSVPFHDVYVHGLVRDADGQKMSKSKGNVLDPLDLIDGITLPALIEKRISGLMQPQMAKRITDDTRRQFPEGIPSYGTDALRFTFASLATQGRDIRFDLGRIEGHRNFCNKLWNATRFVLINTEPLETTPGATGQLGPAERWVISRLQQVAGDVSHSVSQYRFDQVAQTLHSFVWDEFCSWYLEIAKIELGDDSLSADRKLGVMETLVQVLDASLRLLHPIMPFITDTLWRRIARRVGADGPTIMTQPYPVEQTELIDQGSIDSLQWVQSVVSAVRNIRGEINIDPRRPLPALLRGGDSTDAERSATFNRLIVELARLASLDYVTEDSQIPECATAVVGTLTVLVPMGAVIDREAELERLSREIRKLNEDLARTQGKLSNPNFVDKAPVDIVSKERERLESTRSAIAQLQAQQNRVEQLSS
ncbi:MAG: valine--tRNA ligase [Gammaproteobacteria bacterium]|jgi:valyl-tRNA synthetase|nr:MAG: valine--tRNA ligase [Gammaproteobacteria bacterium]HIB82883.1 valine--tRNA ligase [Gammaproteobacteria bacterium]